MIHTCFTISEKKNDTGKNTITKQNLLKIVVDLILKYLELTCYLSSIFRKISCMKLSWHGRYSMKYEMDAFYGKLTNTITLVKFILDEFLIVGFIEDHISHGPQ